MDGKQERKWEEVEEDGKGFNERRPGRCNAQFRENRKKVKKIARKNRIEED